MLELADLSIITHGLIGQPTYHLLASYFFAFPYLTLPYLILPYLIAYHQSDYSLALITVITQWGIEQDPTLLPII